MYSTQVLEKKFLTKAEFCDFCGISESTGYKLMKNRKVEFIKCREGLLHFYKIPIEEAYHYLQEKELKNKGIKVLNRDSKGDLLVTLKAESPKTLDKKAREALKNIEQMIAENQYPKYKRYDNRSNKNIT